MCFLVSLASQMGHVVPKKRKPNIMADGRKMGEKIVFLAPGIHSYLHCQMSL